MDKTKLLLSLKKHKQGSTSLARWLTYTLVLRGFVLGSNKVATLVVRRKCHVLLEDSGNVQAKEGRER
jgi:hypothetical protein